MPKNLPPISQLLTGLLLLSFASASALRVEGVLLGVDDYLFTFVAQSFEFSAQNLFFWWSFWGFLSICALSFIFAFRTWLAGFCLFLLFSMEMFFRVFHLPPTSIVAELVESLPFLSIFAGAALPFMRKQIHAKAIGIYFLAAFSYLLFFPTHDLARNLFALLSFESFPVAQAFLATLIAAIGILNFVGYARKTTALLNIAFCIAFAWQFPEKFATASIIIILTLEFFQKEVSQSAIKESSI
jgi:hypothetical protein